MTSESSPPPPPVSFAADVQPIFRQFRAQMIWRFDLGDYEQVKASASIILARISDPDSPMPPPPFAPLSAAQIKTFRDWIAGEFQP